MRKLGGNLKAEPSTSRPLAQTSQGPIELVCVTGANGFLGHAIVNKLEKMKINVLALSRSKITRVNYDKNENATQIVGSLQDWVDVVHELKPNVIISCDWEGVDKNFRNGIVQSNNAERVGALAEAAKLVGTGTFLAFGSQDEVSPQTFQISENASTNPQSEYGRAKILTKDKLNEILAGTETNFIWARVFTIYGPGDVRSTLITDCIKDRFQETNFMLNHPDKYWSFLFIDDFVNAVLDIIFKINRPLTINVGSDTAVKLQDVVRMIQSTDLSIGAKLFWGEAVRSYPYPTWIPQIDTLKSLGWRPGIDIQDGLFETLNWWSERVIR